MRRLFRHGRSNAVSPGVDADAAAAGAPPPSPPLAASAPVSRSPPQLPLSPATSTSPPAAVGVATTTATRDNTHAYFDLMSDPEDEDDGGIGDNNDDATVSRVHAKCAAAAAAAAHPDDVYVVIVDANRQVCFVNTHTGTHVYAKDIKLASPYTVRVIGTIPTENIVVLETPRMAPNAILPWMDVHLVSVLTGKTMASRVGMPITAAHCDGMYIGFSSTRGNITLHATRMAERTCPGQISTQQVAFTLMQDERYPRAMVYGITIDHEHGRICATWWIPDRAMCIHAGYSLAPDLLARIGVVRGSDPSANACLRPITLPPLETTNPCGSSSTLVGIGYTLLSETVYHAVHQTRSRHLCVQVVGTRRETSVELLSRKSRRLNTHMLIPVGSRFLVVRNPEVIWIVDCVTCTVVKRMCSRELVGSIGDIDTGMFVTQRRPHWHRRNGCILHQTATLDPALQPSPPLPGELPRAAAADRPGDALIAPAPVPAPSARESTSPESRSTPPSRALSLPPPSRTTLSPFALSSSLHGGGDCAAASAAAAEDRGRVRSATDADDVPMPTIPCRFPRVAAAPLGPWAAAGDGYIVVAEPFEVVCYRVPAGTGNAARIAPTHGWPCHRNLRMLNPRTVTNVCFAIPRQTPSSASSPPADRSR